MLYTVAATRLRSKKSSLPTAWEYTGFLILIREPSMRRPGMLRDNALQVVLANGAEQLGSGRPCVIGVAHWPAAQATKGLLSLEQRSAAEVLFVNRQHVERVEVLRLPLSHERVELWAGRLNRGTQFLRRAPRNRLRYRLVVSRSF